VAELVKAYDYTDEKGTLLYQNCRFSPKDFRVRRSDGNGGWIWGRGDIPPTLYRLPELLSAPMQDFVAITEGEKDCDNVRALGLPCTTSGSWSSWKPEFARHFENRLVAVFHDNDDPGREYVKQIVRDVVPVAGELRVVDLPAEVKDISDYLLERDSLDEAALRADLLGMIDRAQIQRLNDPTAGPAAKPEDNGQGEAVYVWMQDVKAEPVRWLWTDRLPAGMLSLLIGLEGSGKTYAALDLAARLTTGRPLPGEDPDHSPPIGNVVYMSSEDHLGFTLKPRLVSMGADPARIAALQGVRGQDGQTDLFSILDHLPALEVLIEKADPVRLVVCDPLTGFMADIDQDRNAPVRAALSRLSALAERTGVPILGISHLSKDTSRQAVHRCLGSVAFSATARSISLISEDKADQDRRIFCPVKCNLCRLPKALAFRIDGGKLNWEDTQFEAKADDILAETLEPPGATREAVQWLRELLADGPVRSKEVEGLAKQEKISWTTLKRAKGRLEVESYHEGCGEKSRWYWKLPKADQEGQEDHIGT